MSIICFSNSKALLEDIKKCFLVTDSNSTNEKRILAILAKKDISYKVFPSSRYISM